MDRIFNRLAAVLGGLTAAPHRLTASFDSKDQGESTSVSSRKSVANESKTTLCINTHRDMISVRPPPSIHSLSHRLTLSHPEVSPPSRRQTP